MLKLYIFETFFNGKKKDIKYIKYLWVVEFAPVVESAAPEVEIENN